MRQIILDTETTGLEPKEGHRIIEIGCVEMIDRRLTGNNLHLYLNPDRAIDPGAQEVHGISSEFLQDKPRFNDIVKQLTDYLSEAELVIHNAPFDVGFLNHELQLCNSSTNSIESICTIFDTLTLARKKHPGQRNSLDALCKRYNVDNSQRQLHGALLDAEILALVYLAMTGGQISLFAGDEQQTEEQTNEQLRHKRYDNFAQQLVTITASEQELAEHQNYLQLLSKAAGEKIDW